ncbi:16S rRNA (guanine(966)-N(2))-methyltransferase RsmD [Fibrobacter sp.]|uniref:16S rRNA (guanine(966)-N(2))-methyltransferase RsmD n=1 Tax=Fibrobacter sp. TaxID=35828 RepID=UPI0025BB54A8|nr:16S rRNA (guanine(966)-N(2))-methyltransferase RsmD [Fibrobacter sp.]MBR3072270.1 16S rRNA (guanine(966)-N(2))-methyltransferase RsmD [Fibrobacter sp.]
MPIRITGGLLRGRNIESPDSMKTRPTASRTREALFNILQGVEGFHMLDLFAGSGIMGLEAISRGAVSVTAVELARPQARMIERSYKAVGVFDKLKLLETNVLTLKKEVLCAEEGFDLIYADPPFKDMDYPDLRPFIEWLNPGGVAVFEAPSRKLPDWATEEGFQGQVRRYGESSLIIVRG